LAISTKNLQIEKYWPAIRDYLSFLPFFNPGLLQRYLLLMSPAVLKAADPQANSYHHPVQVASHQASLVTWLSVVSLQETTSGIEVVPGYMGSSRRGEKGLPLFGIAYFIPLCK
jgi:hypothetical protein